MIAFAKALRDMTAADLMSRDLTLVPQDMSLTGAAHLLSRASISGAPVVNEEGRCVGVLSTTDFVHYVTSEGTQGPHLRERQPERVCDWQVPGGATPSYDEVQTYMTRDPVTVEPNTAIGHLARMMLDAHIHRVVVVDEEKRPIGIVSSTDILAAVAHVELD
jgi:CBS domain-containing protein